MSKFTKGSWTVTVQYDPASATGNGHSMDTAYYLDAGGVGISEEEAHANACLMECAPLLLQQLKFCTAVIKHRLPDQKNGLIAECEALIMRAQQFKREG
jgi:hypothetical protein